MRDLQADDFDKGNCQISSSGTIACCEYMFACLLTSPVMFSGYMALLAQLTETGDVTKEAFSSRC